MAKAARKICPLWCRQIAGATGFWDVEDYSFSGRRGRRPLQPENAASLRKIAVMQKGVSAQPFQAPVFPERAFALSGLLLVVNYSFTR